MTDRTPQADADVIREALEELAIHVDAEDRGHWEMHAGDALDRLLALLAEKDAQVRTLTEALDWLRFSLGSWAVYRERQPCAVFDSNEHRDVLDRIQSALASVQQPPAEEQT